MMQRHAPSSISKPERILADRLQPRTQGKASPDRETANSIQKNKVQWSNYDWSQGGDEWSASWGGTRTAMAQDNPSSYTAMSAFRTYLGDRPVSDDVHSTSSGSAINSLVDLTEKMHSGMQTAFQQLSACPLFRERWKISRHDRDNSVDFVFSWDSLVHVEKMSCSPTCMIFRPSSSPAV